MKEENPYESPNEPNIVEKRKTAPVPHRRIFWAGTFAEVVCLLALTEIWAIRENTVAEQVLFWVAIASGVMGLCNHITLILLWLKSRKNSSKSPLRASGQNRLSTN
jgi:hypothetical protein